MVAGEYQQALKALALAYLLVSTVHLASSENRGYLLVLKDWSLLFEDVAACVSSVGAFKFFTEARNVSKLTRKVVVGPSTATKIWTGYVPDSRTLGKAS
jgi:hypothetical protein